MLCPKKPQKGKMVIFLRRLSFSRKGSLLAGFTFIELLLVILLAAILAGVSYPLLKNNFYGTQLPVFSKKLQAHFIYLRERAIVERKVVYLTFEEENKKYRVNIGNESPALEFFSVPEKVRVETEQEQIAFYPDGSIDKVTINLISPGQGGVNLTTKGVFEGVRVETQQ